MKRFSLSLVLAWFVLTLPALGQSQTPKQGGTLVFGLERELSTFNARCQTSPRAGSTED